MNKKVELVDLVDSNGIVKKRKIPRDLVDNHTGLHLQIIIGVIFNREGEILVHKRAVTKKVNPGDIDHVCGGVMSGETPADAFIRESIEETGIKPKNISLVRHGVNKYNRYRYLFVGESNDTPKEPDLTDAQWIKYIHPDELEIKWKNGELTFVDEFFEETKIAIDHKAN